MITSLQNERVKQIRELQARPRARRKTQRIVLEGTRLVLDALAQGSAPDYVLVTPDADAALLAALHKYNSTLLEASPEVLAHASETQAPQGVIGVFPLPLLTPPAALSQVLILDAVRDPGNLGTLLRTAAAAGVELVLLSPDCADPYNPKVLRAGMGAHFRVPVQEADWSQIAALCGGLPVYIADGAGTLAYDRCDWTAGWALVIGSEAHGASADARRLAAAGVFIPLAAATESLNAAAAAAVILFEAARQRRAVRL